MSRGIVAVAGLCMAQVLLSAHAEANELPDLVKNRLCSSSVTEAIKYGKKSPNCRPGLKKLHVNLTASKHKHIFVLPGGSALQANNVLTFNDSITPEVWRIKANDTLDVVLNNRLGTADPSLQALNLHVHGMIVSPRISTKTVNGHEKVVGTIGDSVFACTVPVGGDLGKCGTLATSSEPDTLHYSIKVPKEHPEGVFWYHPHIHESAAAHIGAGLSGLIWVSGHDVHHRHKGGERFIMLKDFQLKPAANNTWDVYQKDGRLGLDAPKCTDLMATEKNIGYCSGAKDDDGKWLFTVNGKVAPTITMNNAKGEIWHIANTSANMTYRLQLVESSNGKLGKPIPVQILARDGIYVANSGTSFADLGTDPIVMMPAARVDILVQPLPNGGQKGKVVEARLITTGFSTGSADGEGDAWPAAVLADVSLATTSGTEKELHQLEVKGTLVAQIKQASTEIKGNFKKAAAQFMKAIGHNMHHMEAAPATGLDLCDANALKPLDNEYRLAVLNIREKPASTDEEFVMGMDRIPASTPDIPAKIEALTLNPALAKPVQLVPSVCTRANRTETWIVANPLASQIAGGTNPKASTNLELHNFHMHQVKFKVLEVVNANPAACTTSGPNGCVIKMPGGDRLVDTYPVPPGGYIKIEVTFDETQIGDFVYHCHVLEHEDGGMMALIRVEPPAVP